MLVLCPYDTIKRPDGATGRRCAMARYIPTVPNADGATWEEFETLSNHTVVRVNAPQAVLDRIVADPDFTVVQAGAQFRNKLADLGFTASERNAAPTDEEQAIQFLKGFRSEISLSPNGESIVVGPRKVRSAVS